MVTWFAPAKTYHFVLNCLMMFACLCLHIVVFSSLSWWLHPVHLKCNFEYSGHLYWFLQCRVYTFIDTTQDKMITRVRIVHLSPLTRSRSVLVSSESSWNHVGKSYRVKRDKCLTSLLTLLWVHSHGFHKANGKLSTVLWLKLREIKFPTKNSAEVYIYSCSGARAPKMCCVWNTIICWNEKVSSL